MRATIGIIIVFGILYAAGQCMWKPLDKQIQSKPVTKVYILPEKYSLLKNKFGEFVVMVDTIRLMPVMIDGKVRGYYDSIIHDIGYISKEDVMAFYKNQITFNIHDAQLFSDSSIAIKVAYKMDSLQNAERTQEQQKQLEKHIQDSINNLRYSTFKPAK